ncbi:hypothetical protein K458DRAFT_419104 [Lentithecium fluviatile CBS 122367]|uniref:Mid2 domain-containing protein n=1 Tax=Lentithecium fluviatile CBS 122367 TaxID=1168545 RepID=A0A6G1IZ23_9PLEO|nr:hypothetical protein K458DRAFT_419104 [Lentithecium fluviatile CBS 122367]
MRYQLLSFSCALIGGYWLRTVAASCYYPDGSFPSDYTYTECSGDGISTCCIQDNGMQCLSNGLCYSEASNYMYRGGCTDKSWQDEGCFQHCKGTSDSYSSSSWDEIVPCGDNKYCCYSDSSTCCNDDSKVFTVDSGSVIKELSGTATDALPIATSTKSSTSGSTSKPTSSSTSTSSSSPEPATSSSSKDSTFSKTAIIGVAGGGVALLLLAIFLVFFFVRRRYRKKLASTANANSIPLSNSGFQKLQDKPELDSQQLPDKSPRPVEVPAPMHSPAPPYQPPQYGYVAPQGQHGVVEIGGGYRGPERNQWGQPIFEAPAQPYRHQ